MSSPPKDREFCRVLQPVDAWVASKSTDEELLKALRGTYEKMSVALIGERCSPIRVLASFYGYRSTVPTLFPQYFRFTEGEVAGVGATFEQQATEPPWPPEYSEAHHNLSGNQVEIARTLIGHHREAPRSKEVTRLELFREICTLLGREDVNSTFKTSSEKHLRRLVKDPQDRQTIWVELAKEFPRIVLDDETVQAIFRKLYVEKKTEWDECANQLPNLNKDQRFRDTSKRRPNSN